MNTLSKKETAKSSKILCPVCHSQNLLTFFKISDVPASCNTLWPTREKARNSPKGDIRLGICSACSYIMNEDFKLNRLKYTQAYGNPLHFSPYFKNYAQSLAERLVEKYNLHEKDVIEIGSGDGYFLKLLCRLGNNKGVGFDPAYVEQKKNNVLNGQVKFIQDYYSERYRDYQSDLVVCRQTLEHIPKPISFLKMLRRVIGNRKDTYLIFEVPNATQILRKLFIWDIIYEHCSYFTPLSLAYAFSASGFHIDELIEEFEGQFLCIHARPGNQIMPNSHSQYQSEVNKILNDVKSFAVKYQNKVQTCRQKLDPIVRRGQLVVIWGAGSKGVSFLNTLKDLQIEYVVDINPKKQGMHIPGTGQQIIPPEFLQESQPDLIIVMNPIYWHEIQQLTKKLGLTVKLISV